jgi:Domain of unknown function (DUF5134)
VAGPAWLTGIFAALMLTVAVYCAGRLAVTRRWRRATELDTDAGHVLMGAAMAGMLVARLRILPAATWEAVFAVGAAWFAWRLLQSRRRAPATWRCLNPAPHLVECGAMLYMFLVLPPLTGRAAASGMAGMAGLGASAAGSRYSFLALVMGLFMVGYVARTADRLPRGRTADGRTTNGLPGDRRPAASLPSGPVAQSPRPARPYLAPRCAALCKIAMGLTMTYMLVLTL